MKILIIGSNGLLGDSLIRFFHCEQKNKVYGISRNKSIQNLSNFYQIDFLDESYIDKMKRVRDENYPDLVINASGLVSLSDCENNQQNANFLNGIINNEIINIFDESNYVYISTDSVFNGKKGDYKEHDQTEPLNSYAKSKIIGENYVLKYNCPRYKVLRTNLYGYGMNVRNSLANWALDSFRSDKDIDGFTNFLFNPLHTTQVGEVIKSLDFTEDNNTLYHLGSTEKISKFQFLETIKNHLSNTKSIVSPVEAKIPHDSIIRPQDTTLNTSLFEKKYKKKFSLIDGINKIVSA